MSKEQEPIPYDRRHWAMGLGLVTLLGLAVSIPIAMASHFEPEYAGAFLVDEGASIAFEIERDERGRREALVRPKGFEIHCEDGAVRTVNFAVVPFDFESERTFRQQHYDADPHDIRHYNLYEVKGHLAPGGRAQGYLSFESGWTGTPPADSDQSTCRTDGRLRWEATKVP